ncbi:uncharacterized protein LOC144743047 [Ciona intestinalis]
MLLMAILFKVLLTINLQKKAQLGTKYNYEESKNLMDETNKLLAKHAAKNAARKIEIAEEKKKIEKMKKMQEEDRIEEMISEMSSVEEKPKVKITNTLFLSFVVLVVILFYSLKFCVDLKFVLLN